jgi:phage anti-repressor protein
MELIPIIKTSTNLNAVDGRTLHSFLEVGKDFSNWIKAKIEKYDFVENVDYEVFANSGENSNGGRPSKEYIISLDMAKEVSMVENNQKGREARQYFIKAEKTLSEVAKKRHTLETQISVVKIALDWLNASESSKLRAMQILFESNGLDKKMLPDYTSSKGTIKSASELLKENGITISTIAFNKLMIAEGLLVERTRPSTKNADKIKTFKALSELGLVYGENLQSPQNPKEVQPMYYAEKFQDLCKILGIQ